MNGDDYIKKNSKFHKYIDFSNLPKGSYGIDWESAIGYKIYFEYEDIKDYLEIIGCDKINGENYINIRYKDNEDKLYSGNLKKVYLGKILGRFTGEYKIDLKQILNEDKRNITIVHREKRIRERKGRTDEIQKWYEYKCNICSYKGWMEESNLLKGKGCPCCSVPPRVVVKGINDIATTEPWMVEYFVDEEDAYQYTSKSNKKVKVKCPDCGNIKNMTISSLYINKFSCRKCGDGVKYPNKFMFNVLEQLNVEFQTEYSPKWANGRRYDFYIPSKNLIIEMDGGWHYKDNKMSGKTRWDSQEIDIYKDLLAMEQGVKLIRINCDYKHSNRFDYIKNNTLKGDLSEYFELNLVDWNKIDEIATSNRTKKICLFYEKNKQQLTINEISRINKLNKDTLIEYLKKGTKFGWCEYVLKRNKTKVSCNK